MKCETIEIRECAFCCLHYFSAWSLLVFGIRSACGRGRWQTEHIIQCSFMHLCQILVYIRRAMHWNQMIMNTECLFKCGWCWRKIYFEKKKWTTDVAIHLFSEIKTWFIIAFLKFYLIFQGIKFTESFFNKKRFQEKL